MSKDMDKKYRELLEIIMGLSREIRCCSRDEAVCGGVTFQQFVILDAVAKKRELGLAELHGILSVEKSTTTRLVNPLLENGLLKRNRAAHDSRAARLTLTEEGAETHRKVWLCLGGFFEAVTRQIPEGRRTEVLKSVRVFTEAIRRAAGDCRCSDAAGGGDFPQFAAR